jgi:hypothetical protein
VIILTVPLLVDAANRGKQTFDAKHAPTSVGDVLMNSPHLGELKSMIVSTGAQQQVASSGPAENHFFTAFFKQDAAFIHAPNLTRQKTQDQQQ